MTKFLTGLGEGRVIVALEGGYNLTSISYCMALCAKALLGDPLPCLSSNLIPCQSAVDSLTSVVNAHRKFWSCLNFKVVSNTDILVATYIKLHVWTKLNHMPHFDKFIHVNNLLCIKMKIS